MKKLHNIYYEKDHRWAVVIRDPERPSYLIDTNECLVTSGTHSLLTDPGGMEIFPAVFSAISTEYNPRNIKMIFASHQDPDIISSLSLWMEVNPELKCYLSWLWTTFVPHFGGNDKTFVAIPDDGMVITLGEIKLKCIPAHYLHSSGNFHLYDPRAKVYFSGDVGAALLGADADIYVKNFDEHIKHARGFHERWMGCNEARLDWCQRASEMEIDMMVPQHGSIYQGKDVKRFIDWFSELRVGLFTMAPEQPKPSDSQTSAVQEEIHQDLSAEVMNEVVVETVQNQDYTEAEDFNKTGQDEPAMHALMDIHPESSEEAELLQKPSRRSLFSAIKSLFTSRK